MESKGSKYLYDYFVIGGGSGGLASAKRAAKLGKRVALADFVKPSPAGTKWGIGGTCVNVGCIPKKLMHFAALTGELRHDQEHCGWEVDLSAQHDWSAMISNVNNHIRSLNWGYKTQLMKEEVKYYNALASIEDAHTVKLIDTKTKEPTYVTAEHICIAVGGRPQYLDIPNCKELCISSDDLFWLKKPPGRSLIIGAGYIALECGGFLRGMGRDVDILVRSRPLRGFDSEMVDKVIKYMEYTGIQFLTGTPISFDKEGEGVKVGMKVTDDGKEVEKFEVYDNVLVAIGRYPDIGGLNLEKVGVELAPNGKIKVNNRYQTSVDSIYALGDVCSIGLELTPVAIKEGHYLVDGLFKDEWREIDYKTVCTTVFTPLEYSVCGLNERDAIKLHGEDDIEVYTSGFKPTEWAFDPNKPKDVCMTKAIVQKSTRKVVGLHYTGLQAGEVMQGYGVAMRLGLTFEDFVDTVAVHPTGAEEIVTLKTKKKPEDLIK